MKKLFFVFLITSIYNYSHSQNRVGIYTVFANTVLLNNSAAYSKDVYLKLTGLRERQPFYGDLYFFSPAWSNGLGFWILIKQKKRFSFYGTAGRTSFRHKTFYNGGKSEDYPFPVLKPFPAGNPLTIENTVTQHLFTLGVKSEYKINTHFNIEVNADYCFVPKKNSHVFYSSFSTTVSTPPLQQGSLNLFYTDTNPSGIINTKAGINCNLSNKFKVHILYLRTINGVNKYKEFMPFKYRLQYSGIALQLSYSFLNPNKGDND